MRDHYTTGQAAKVLGVCVRTVQLWVEEGRLEAWKTGGGHRRLDKGAVDQLAEEEALGRESGSGPAPRAAARRVLLVDDSKADSRLIRKMILKAQPDAVIEEAEDGFDALIKIGQKCPDTLFLDLQMPGIDGFQMLESIAQRFDGTRMDVFVMTAYDPEELDRLGGVPSVVKRVLHKPVDIKEIFSIL